MILIKQAPELEPDDAEVRFFVFAKVDADEMKGGIRASSYWIRLHIELLWLPEACRNQGIGKLVVETAENSARQNHCEKALLQTTSWQAKPFYEKNGYKLLATLEHRPKGHATHYLNKTLF
nr:GNAT family N-acetyltransferase [Flavobacterium sp. NKUCC04_CG]